MKLNRIITALFGTALLAGAWSCTDEVKYTPVGSDTGDQVYFSSTENTVLDLPAEGAEFVNIPIFRHDTSKELTVALQSAAYVGSVDNDVSDIFNLPSAITFPAGESKAEIQVTFMMSEIEPDTDYSLWFKIADEQTTQYGLSECVFTVSYSPFGEFERMSETEGMIMEFNTPIGGPFEVENYAYISKSLVSDNIVRYYGEFDPYTNLYWPVNLTVDFRNEVMVDGVKCYYATMSRESTHFTGGGLEGTMYVEDAFSFYKSNNPGVDDATIHAFLANNGYQDTYFNPETGLFTIGAMYSDDSRAWAPIPAYVQLPGYKVYDLTISVAGQIVDSDEQEGIILNVLKSADVDNYAMVVEQGALTDDEIKAAITAIKENEDITLYSDLSKDFTYYFSDWGKYTAVAVGYDANGEEVCSTHLTFDFETIRKDVPWKSVGTALYTDGLLTTMGQSAGAGSSWEVEVEESTETPGYYRLVNPYKFWAEEIALKPEYLDRGRHYLYVNAVDKRGVILELSELGLTISQGNGAAYAYSVTAAELAKGTKLAMLKLQGKTGRMTNNVITFPAKVPYVGYANTLGTWVESNLGSTMAIDLSDLQAAPAKKSAKANIQCVAAAKKQIGGTFEASAFSGQRAAILK